MIHRRKNSYVKSIQSRVMEFEFEPLEDRKMLAVSIFAAGQTNTEMMQLRALRIP